MSMMKTFLTEYEEMGNKFDYKSYEEIPRSIIEILEDYSDTRNIFKMPLKMINEFLMDLYEDFAEANQVTNIGVYDDRNAS